MTDSTNYQFDRLKMYFGEDYIVNGHDGFDNIIIHQPTIGEILNDENSFYQMLYVFIGNTTMRRLQLWEMNVDWNTISDYELFGSLIKGLDVKDTSVMFGDLDFRTFDLYARKNDDGEEIPTLYSEQFNIEISENTYFEIREYLRLLFSIYPKVEFATNRATKEAIIDEEKSNIEFAKFSGDDDVKSMLLPLVSFCVNHPGFKYKINDLYEMSICQFMDSVQRLQIYESTRALYGGMYSGMADLSKVPKEDFNFARDTKTKE